jgi:hypothetical protein
MKRILFPAVLLAALALAGCGPNRAPENTGNSSTEMDGRNLQPDSTVHPADNTTTPINSADDDSVGRDKGTGHRGQLDNMGEGAKAGSPKEKEGGQ